MNLGLPKPPGPNRNVAEDLAHARDLSAAAGGWLAEIDSLVRDDDPIVQMLNEARINLAYLERFLPALMAQPEGGLYLRLLSETASGALAYATKSSSCSAPSPLGASSGTAPAPTAPSGAGATHHWVILP